MKNNLAQIINNNYMKGVKHGWNAFVMAFFVGVYNVQVETQIIPEDRLLEFCDAVETELIRIFRDEMHNNPDDVDALVVAAMNARERIGLPEEPQLWDAARGTLNKEESKS